MHTRHLLTGLLALLALAAQADQPRGGRDRGEHWEFDGRFQHNHYYPSRGYVVPSLPQGGVEIGYGPDRFYFQAGVWFRAAGRRFVVVDPPLGIVVPMLPPGCVTLQVGMLSYCYANGVYYLPGGAGGYVVSAPPPAQAVQVQPAPLVQPLPQTGGRARAPILYPRNGQAPGQIDADRQECERWASGQLGAGEAQVYSRAFDACMDARGYTVR